MLVRTIRKLPTFYRLIIGTAVNNFEVLCYKQGRKYYTVAIEARKPYWLHEFDTLEEAEIDFRQRSHYGY